MNNRRAFLISLLVLGLILLGGGIWWKMDSASVKVTIQPIISMEVTDDNVGSHDNLYICEDGSVYLFRELEARPDLGRGWSTTYYKGQLDASAFANLIQLFQDNVDQLQDSYQYSGYDGGTGTVIKGHMDTVLAIKYQGMARKITANDYLGMYSSYLSPDSEYAGMPSPLDQICRRLSQIGALTAEFYKETTPN